MKNINRNNTEKALETKSPDEILQNLESREELLGKIENPPKTPSILTQKLSGSFSIPKVETDYSLKNLQSSNTQNETTVKKVDPYREIPE